MKLVREITSCQIPPDTSNVGLSRSACFFRLYVAGASSRSQQAIVRVHELCRSQLNDDYTLEVVDIYQQPLLALEGRILATPTLVKIHPDPIKRMTGRVSDNHDFFRNSA